jgi:hypothetical protein
MISRELFKQIVSEVEHAGGDLNNVKDLVEVWQRLERVKGPVVDAMRREAQANMPQDGDWP